MKKKRVNLLKKKKVSPNYRAIYRFVGGRKGRVSKIDFKSIKKGDYFFLENACGDMVVDHGGFFIFKALRKAAEYQHPKYSALSNCRVEARGVA